MPALRLGCIGMSGLRGIIDDARLFAPPGRALDLGAAFRQSADT